MAAAAYVSRGWPVLPLHPRLKTPLGSLVPNGLLQASTTMADVVNWWGEEPKANIGLRTGEVFDVLDVDGPKGRESMEALAYRHSGPVASTGKGWHLLFAVTGARNAANPVTGLDFRGQNGYIVAPPSVHPNGHSYAWIRDGELPEPPDWLLQLVTPTHNKGKVYLEGSGIDPANLNPIIPTFQTLFSSIRHIQAIGARGITNCLFHEDDTPSLVLYPDTNSFYCFGCGAWGDSANLTNYALTGELR